MSKMTRQLRNVAGLACAAFFLAGMPLVAEANVAGERTVVGAQAEPKSFLSLFKKHKPSKPSKPDYKPTPKPSRVPELDPSAAGAALLLLVGGSLVLIERRRVRA
jgi:hypothetical protein